MSVPRMEYKKFARDPDGYPVNHDVSKTEFDFLVGKARKTNAERDQIDRDFGHLTPSEGSLPELMATAFEAIRCGMIMNNWDCIAEGYVMLEEATDRARKLVGETS